MQELQDRFGRRFSYLRLSVTDACNFRCSYCLPAGYQKGDKAGSDLQLSEIKNLVRAMTELGTRKVRLTGGEPTVRRDLLEVVRSVGELRAGTAPLKIALSTNGYRLKQMAKELGQAGVSAVNVSVDSLSPEKFAQITGQDLLPEVLAGIERAIEVGFEKVKVNAVLLKDWNNQDLTSFLDWIRDRPIVVRFIELMPTGQNQKFFQKYHLQSSEIHQRLTASGWVERKRGDQGSDKASDMDGPAVEFGHSDYLGKIGIIAPYSKDFCATCNRLRVTSQGGLRLCLFGEGNYSVRHLLQSEDQKEELKSHISALLNKKEISHYLPEGRYGNNQTFSAMGG